MKYTFEWNEDGSCFPWPSFMISLCSIERDHEERTVWLIDQYSEDDARPDRTLHGLAWSRASAAQQSELAFTSLMSGTSSLRLIDGGEK
ncbi:hypothetical protein J5289_01535 [Rhizobium sp. B230/85]|uniref:hypothetical protein n=1 Tax=unclassified Rhizobium TaxID=2613769 RepID=UPI001ADB9FC6|nr:MULTISPECIES: hypothetical protein [unclassified Rhizobium]MBO9135515.1 hypothetical protein [Rhizobium sp. B209b/85]QXZ96323.1 hypothetical protein J5289_01535 [Rhizobium sp. B230/85]